MNIEQLYFTRTDGDNSGWRFVNISAGVTEDIKQSFQGIHTHTPSTKDMYTFDFYNKKFYLSKVTADGTDALGRAKSFIHGYVFSGVDSDYLFSNSARLLNMDSFAKSEESDLTPVDDLPFSEYDATGVAKKLNLENLMNGVYEAVLENKPLYIYSDIDANEILIKAIMCVVYELLPLNLRKHISFSSAEGGLSRTITIINSLDNVSGMIYDFATGNINGCDGKYNEFVKAMLSEPKTHLEGVNKYIEDAHETSYLNVDAYNKAFNYILMRNSNAEDVSNDEVVAKLADLLLAEKFNDQANASYIAMLILRIVNNRIEVSSAINSMIVGAYMKTNNTELKENIATYIAYSYENKCSEKDFEKFQELKFVDSALYKNVSVAAISKNSEEFIRHFAISALKNIKDCSFITDECGTQCSYIVARSMAKYIVELDNGYQEISNVVNGTLHKQVMDCIVTFNPNKEIIWSYVEQVFASTDKTNTFKTLENETVRYVFSFLVDNCYDSEERVVSLLSKMVTTDRECYVYLEGELSKNSKHSILDMFYTTVLLERSTSIDNVIKLQKRLSAISTKTDNFDKNVLSKFLSLAKGECITVSETRRIIEKTNEFMTNMREDSIYYIQQLKEHFWNHFDIGRWDMNTDYSSLFISGNKNSEIVFVLHNIIGILRKEQELDERIIESAIFILSSKESPVRENDRDKIIRKLKANFISDEMMWEYNSRRGSKKKSYRSAYSKTRNSFDMDMDLFLLMNYSNATESLNSDMNIPDVEALAAYIYDCSHSRRTEHLISKENVIVNLYQMLYERIDRSPRRGAEYRKALEYLDSYIEQLSGNKKRAVMKEVKKITEVPDYTWISFISMLFMCISLYSLIGAVGLAGWLVVVIRALLVFAGVVFVGADSIIDAKEHGRIVSLLTQFVSGCSLFVALLITLG